MLIRQISMGTVQHGSVLEKHNPDQHIKDCEKTYA